MCTLRRFLPTYSGIVYFLLWAWAITFPAMIVGLGVLHQNSLLDSERSAQQATMVLVWELPVQEAVAELEATFLPHDVTRILEKQGEELVLAWATLAHIATPDTPIPSISISALEEGMGRIESTWVAYLESFEALSHQMPIDVQRSFRNLSRTHADQFNKLQSLYDEVVEYYA